MMNKATKAALILVAIFFTSSAAFAQTQTDTNCNATSSTSINCTSTTTSTGPTAAQVEQQKEMNENAHKMGAALGSLIAQKRAQNAEEKNDLTAVTFCRQNPAGNWTFPNKAPMPCATLERNVVAYCTVNPKKHICKDVAKLPPASAQMLISPDEERVTINVVYCQQNPNGTVTTGNGEKKGCSDEIAYMTAFCTIHEWKGKPCVALSSNKATAIVPNEAPQLQTQQAPVTTQAAQSAVVSPTQQQVQPSQAQPQQAAVAVQPPPQPAPVAAQPVQNVVVPQAQPGLQTMDVPTTPEVSIAEAARRNKAAKEAAKAKENPPPQQ